MTDDQLIESLRARTWPGDCEAAAFRLEELRARVAELEALPGNVMARRVERLAHPNGSKPESVNAELLEALKDARHCIGIDRDTLVDCHTNPCTGYLDPDGALAKAEYDDVIDAADAAIARAESAIESSSKPCAFRLGDLVKKVSGSAWEGRIVGTYSTALTPEGYAVESASHPGSVQIYPAKALTLVIQEAGIQPTEGQHAQHVDVSGENVNATFRISKQTGADALVGLRGCNSRHGGMRAVEPCGYRMRTTDPGCTGCVERDEDQPAEAGGYIE